MNKRKYLLYILIAALLITSQYLTYSYLEKQKIDQLQADNLVSTTLASQVMTDWLWKGLVDLKYLSTLESVQAFIDGFTDDAKSQSARDFAKFSESITLYDQIRILDADGLERIRVDFEDGDSIIIPSDQLQDKSSRYYFIECNQIPVGEFYVSPLDLNIENEEIEIPYKPVIRICTPLADQKGEKKALLILNYLASNALDRFAAVDDNLMLVNSQGYWLHSPNADETWGFMFEQEISFSALYPEEWLIIKSSVSGSFRTKQGLWDYSKVDLSNEILQNPNLFIDQNPEEVLHGLDALDWITIFHAESETLVEIRMLYGMPILLSSFIIYPLAYFGLWNFFRRREIEKSEAERTRFMATHDLMTGLLNRAVFDTEIYRINHSRLYPVSIMIMDANNLKTINDTLGHQEGDKLLNSIAAVLTITFRTEDIIARLGGDEFGILLPQTDRDKCRIIRKRLQENIEKHNIKENILKIDVAIGTATSVENEDLHNVFKRADENMYAEKIASKKSLKAA